MVSSHRVLALFGTCCAVAAVATPVVALAHSGRGGDHRSGPKPSGPEQTCKEVGVSLNGHARGGLHAYGLGGLSAEQVKALETACNKLASAYATERSADSAAFKTEQQALETALTQLNKVCPRSHRHHRHHQRGLAARHHRSDPTGPTGLTGP